LRFAGATDWEYLYSIPKFRGRRKMTIEQELKSEHMDQLLLLSGVQHCAYCDEEMHVPAGPLELKKFYLDRGRHSMPRD
jgi:hypothetical protein